MRGKRKCKAFSIIQEMSTRYPISLLCSVVGVSRSGYYQWLKRKQHPSDREQKNQPIKARILECYREVNGIYGYPRVKLWLYKKYGIRINHKRVYRLMKELGLQARIRKKRKYFGRKEPAVMSDNQLNRDFTASHPNEKWVTDITYLSFNGHRLYLSVIYDLFNNEVISHRISKRNDLRLVMETVKAAVKKRDAKGILLHSDQGFQYTSRQYHKLLQRYNIIPSMSRKGNCLDNACIESFFGHLKSECLYLRSLHTDEEVRQAVNEYIHFYNHQRFQIRLNHLSPVDYRAKTA